MALEEAHNQDQAPSKEKTKPSKDIMSKINSFGGLVGTVVKSGKRMYKDARYGRSGGFGSARKRKGNTEESIGDMSNFHQTRSTKSKKAPRRLGKNRRIGKVSKQRSRKTK